MPKLLAQWGATYHDAMAVSWVRRFQRDGNSWFLDHAVRAAQRAVALADCEGKGFPRDFMYLSNLTWILMKRFEQAGKSEDLDAAIDAGHRAVARAPADHPQLAVCLSRLEIALSARYQQAGSAVDLEAAIDTARRAALLTSPNDPNFPVVLGRVALCLVRQAARSDRDPQIGAAIDAWKKAAAAAPEGHVVKLSASDAVAELLNRRVELRNDWADLDEAIAASREAIAVLDPPRRVRIMRIMSSQLSVRFERSPASDDLNALIEALEVLVEAAEPDGPDLAQHLTDLGLYLCIRYERNGQREDLDAAINTEKQAAVIASPGSAEYARCQYELSISYQLRFERYDDYSDLDRAINAGRAAVAVTPSSGRQPAGADTRTGASYDGRRHESLAKLLGTRFSINRDLIDLHDAISAQQMAISGEPSGNSRIARYLADLAIMLSERFDQAGDITDLQDAFSAAQQAVELARISGQDQARCISALAGVKLSMFMQSESEVDLDGATEAARQAVALTSVQEPYYQQSLSALGLCLRYKFEQKGNLEELDASIDAFRDAGALVNLSGALRLRFLHKGAKADLDAAVDAARRMLAQTPSRHMDRPSCLAQLGAVLGERFECTGDAGDLDAAIDSVRQAAGMLLPGHSDFPVCLGILGSLLMQRYDLTTDTGDLDAAVKVRREALEVVQADTKRSANYFMGLSTALRKKGMHSGDRADLDAAVEAAQRGAALIPPESADFGTCQSILADSLRDRFELTGNGADLDIAIEARERAVAAEPSDHRKHPSTLTGLALVLKDRFQLDGNLADLDRAISIEAQAIALAPYDDPSLAGWLTNLGSLHKLRFDLTHDTADLDVAIMRWQQACEMPTGLPLRRIVAAREWGRAAAGAGRTRLAAEGFSAAVQLLPVVAWHGLGRAVREHHLANAAGFGADAATCAILGGGDPERAVEVLEQSRSVLWSQALGFRSDLSRLEAAAPDLARRLEQIRHVLDPAASVPVFAEGTRDVAYAPQFRHEEGARRQYAREWDSVLARIRAIDEFTHFMEATPFAELAAASRGPVAVLNASSYGCHALIIANGQVRVAEMERLTLAAIEKQAAAMQDAVLDIENREWRERNEMVLDILGWLWESIAEPVLQALEDIGADNRRQRIWWCPVGPLSLLPIHAAGLYSNKQSTADAIRCLPNRVISSYTPSLAAHKRASQRDTPVPMRHLSVGVSAAPGLPELPAVSGELQALAEYFPSESGHLQLAERQANRGAVLEAMDSCSWVHLSCHGVQHPDPDTSGFALWDAPLTISDLAAQATRQRDLAFLSACQTATGSVQHLDEAIHLAAAMQFLGYQHVIATLWTIADRPAALIAKLFYTTIINGSKPPDTSRSAEALQDSVAILRQHHPDSPLLWAPYIHLGP